jgi:hypothetical protein
MMMVLIISKKKNTGQYGPLRTVVVGVVIPCIACAGGVTRIYWEIEAKKGLPSADRNNKATLLLTGPFRTAKSSAKDLIPHPPKLQYASRRRSFLARRGVRLLGCEAGAYSHAPEACGRRRRVPARILT